MYNQYDGNNQMNQNYDVFGKNQNNQSAPTDQNPIYHSGVNQSGNFTYQQTASAAAVKKPSKGKGVWKVAALLVAVVVLATGGGFGGAILAQHLGSNGSDTTSVLTQSVVNTSSDQGATDGTSVSDIVDATASSVVEITTETVETSQFMQQYTSSGAGSGVIITSDGYIVTNNHVISGANKITVTLKSGESYEAKLIGTDETTDIAVIKIEATDLQAAVLGDSDTLKVGDLAVAIGNPLGELGGTVTSGIISALDREITVDNQTMTLLQTSAAVNPGNSGGGLFNGKGELIGIVNAKTSSAGIEGLGFAIPINTAKPVIEDLMENGYVTGRIKLGVTFVDIQDQQTAMQYRVNQLGTYVYQVNEGSDAEKAGLLTGDRIVSIDGTEVSSVSEIKQMMNDYSVGDQMKITVERGNQNIDLTVTFTEYTPENEQ
jgi:serine protease Do